MPNAAKATKRYEQRMKDKGFVRKHVWVPAWKAKEIEELAEKLRRESGEWTEEEFSAAREKIASQIENIEEGLMQLANVKHITIFGSYAMGDATPASDVDLLVEFEPYAERSLSLISGVEQLLRDSIDCEVDVVFDEVKNKRLRKSIEQYGMRIF